MFQYPANLDGLLNYLLVIYMQQLSEDKLPEEVPLLLDDIVVGDTAKATVLRHDRAPCRTCKSYLVNSPAHCFCLFQKISPCTM